MTDTVLCIAVTGNHVKVSVCGDLTSAASSVVSASVLRTVLYVCMFVQYVTVYLWTGLPVNQ
jgi:hypothetical protein